MLFVLGTQEHLDARSHHGHSRENIRTFSGCTCDSVWTVNNKTCLDGSTTYHGCGMATPCDGANNGQCGISWCVIDPASCASVPAGLDWDYCSPLPQLLTEPMWVGPYINTRPLVGACNLSSVVKIQSISVSECQSACVAQSGCNTITYNGTCALLDCGSSGSALASGGFASGEDSYSVVNHPQCCEDPSGVPCQFPFEFGNDLYTNCTPITADGSPYCPIQRDDYRVLQWGSCGCTPMEHRVSTTTFSATTTQSVHGNATTLPVPSTTHSTHQTTIPSNRTHKVSKICLCWIGLL